MLDHVTSRGSGIGSSAGHTTKRWTSTTGRAHGGRPLTQKYIHRILTNPLYIGRIASTRGAGEHENWRGRHEPIIERGLWDRVQSSIEAADRSARHRWSHPHLLKGKLRTYDDHAMSPGSVHRPGRNGTKRLVRYYISQKAIRQGYKTCAIKTINAKHLDDLVRALVMDHLLSSGFDQLERKDQQVREYWIREMIDRVELAPEQLTLKLSSRKLAELREYDFGPSKTNEPPARPTCPYTPTITERNSHLILTLNIQIKRLDGKRLLLTADGRDLVISSQPEPKNHIVHAIGRAYRWRDMLLEPRSAIPRVAQATGTSEQRLRRLLPLINLSPPILKRALTGDLPPSVTLDDLLLAARQLDWNRQAQVLGLDDSAAPVQVSPTARAG